MNYETTVKNIKAGCHVLAKDENGLFVVFTHANSWGHLGGMGKWSSKEDCYEMGLSGNSWNKEDIEEQFAHIETYHPEVELFKEGEEVEIIESGVRLYVNHYYESKREYGLFNKNGNPLTFYHHQLRYPVEEEVKEIQRYDVTTKNAKSISSTLVTLDLIQKHDDDGRYVLYEDHLKALEQLSTKK